jgi:hypothetical protein
MSLKRNCGYNHHGVLSSGSAADRTGASERPVPALLHLPDRTMRIALLLALIIAFLAGIGIWSFHITAGLAGADGGVAIWVAGGAGVAAALLIGGFVLLILRTRPRDHDRN